MVGMRRRGLLVLVAGLPIAGCTGSAGDSPPAEPAPTTASPAATTRSPQRWAARATPAVATDYTWLVEDPKFSGLGFCLTWLRGVTPAEFARRLGARAGQVHPWDSLPEPDEDDALLAITDTGDWSLLVEYNGFVAIEDELMQSLSAGTRLISNYCNVESDSRFVLVEDGTIVADFDPTYPARVYGSAPDRIRAEMAGLGFDDTPRRDYTEAALVLTERLTGVPLTEQNLRGSDYLAAAVRDPFGGR
jgi:hypothetical protein